MLEKVMNSKTEKEVVLPIGDFIAKVINDNTGCQKQLVVNIWIYIWTMNKNVQNLAFLCK